jgi:hypothetical protein
MKTYAEVDVYNYVFLTSALVENEWSASRPRRFNPGERDPGTHWTGGWVGNSRSLRQGEVKILDHAGTQTPTPSVVQPVAIPALYGDFSASLKY